VSQELIMALRDFLNDIQSVPELQEEARACRVLLRFLGVSIE
jgi:hypothetical protein